MAKIVKKDLPPANQLRKPTAKKKFSLDDFKKKIGAEKVSAKPLIWIPVDDALQEATGLPGVPKGYVTLFRGYSNTGKSTALMRAVVNAQKMGMLPVIIDTENNIQDGNLRLKNMGFDWDGDYILIHNKNLLEKFGKVQDKDRKEASIEDLAKYMYYILDQQEAGLLPFDLFFAIDSIGTLNCIKTINALVKDTNDNNMWNAGAYEKVFMSMFNNTIPNSRNVDSEYTNTVAMVQKVWYDSMNKVIKHKGGEFLAFAARLNYHFGGIITHGTRRITADSKKRTLNYGFENKVNIAKNHIDGVFGGISLEGKIISTPHGFIYPERLDEYKKKFILHFRNIFNDDTLTVEDVQLNSKNMDGEGNVIEASKVSIGDDSITKNIESVEE